MYPCRRWLLLYYSTSSELISSIYSLLTEYQEVQNGHESALTGELPDVTITSRPDLIAGMRRSRRASLRAGSLLSYQEPLKHTEVLEGQDGALLKFAGNYHNFTFNVMHIYTVVLIII
jgi:hypothetical protein